MIAPREATRPPQDAAAVGGTDTPVRPDAPAGGTTTLVRWVRDPERDADDQPLDLRLIRRLLAYMRPYRRKRNALFVAVILRAVQLPLVAWSIGATINGPISHQAPLGQILTACVGVWLLGLFTHLTFHFRYRLALELGEAVMHDLRDEIFVHLQRLPLAYFQRTKIGRVISRMTSDCEAMRIGIQDVLFIGMVGAGQMLVSAAFMAYFDRVLFGVLLAMTPILWGLNHYFRRLLSRAYRNVQESFSRVTATLAESVAGIRVTQGFVREATNAQLFEELIRDHAHHNQRAARTAGIFLPLLELNSQLFIAILLVLGGYRALNPAIGTSVGDLIQFFFLAGIFFGPIQILGNQYNQALTAMAGAERVFRLLDLQPDWSDAADAQPLGRLAGRVEFSQVTFGYDPRRPVLKDVSFVAEPGQTLALVGHTGSGKTTIINLVARFYLPDSGTVRFDGRDTRQIRGESLHSQLGLILQQNFLFSGSVLDNIRVGRPGATDEQVREAVARLDCLDLLDALPDGLHTQAGERGGRLSLGQRQLVCFARAMLADPRIVILDEATSAVDTVTELRIQVALRRLLAGRTTFVVAHRLSTIRHADCVLVLERGRIVERGAHEELLAVGRRYAALYGQFLRSDAAE